MFGVQVGPAAFGSDAIDGGYRLEVSQKYPWPGKCCLRGQNAAAEARAAEQDVEGMRLQLAQTARDAFADYYLAGRGLTVSKEALDLLAAIQSNQETLFTTGKIQEEDLLQTKVEIGRQRQRRLTMERMVHTARARINTLLHLPPDAPLPAPPSEIPVGGPLPDERATAPGPGAAAGPAGLVRTRRGRAGVAGPGPQGLSPRLRVHGRLRYVLAGAAAPAAGGRADEPAGSPDEARRGGPGSGARLNQRVAELNKRTDDVNLAVDQAYQETAESDQTVRLYEQTILPDAELNVKSAQTSYTTGKIATVTLIDAERS